MIIVVGSLNMDLVINAENIPRPGETVLGNGFKQIPGGKGANQADAVAKLGADVAMVGAVGDDSFGQALTESLRRDQVDVSHVTKKPGVPTGVAAIIVEKSGNNAITVASGANFELMEADVDYADEVFERGDILLTQLESPLDTVIHALKKARKHEIRTILNPAPGRELPDEIYPLIDVITPNETELEILTGLPVSSLEEIEKASNVLLHKGIKDVLVTLGSNGALHVTEHEVRHHKGHQVKAVDTTAAGDCFNGAVAVGLSEGKDLSSSITFAMAAAALSVTRHGAQTSLPMRADVDNFMKEGIKS